MGLVSEHLIKMIAEQVDRHGTVVWFDPGSEYSQVARSLKITEGQVFLYDERKGFIALRRELEPLWVAETPPRLVIYVPMDLEDTHNALIEYTVAGVIMRPGQQPPERNTRLSVVARRALEGLCPKVVVDQYVTDAEAGKLNLSELDDLAENCAEGLTGALSLIFDNGNPEEIALYFLADTGFDHGIEEKDALGNLAELFTNTFGMSFAKDKDDLPSLRAQLTRFILGTELRETLGGELPERLEVLPKPQGKPARESALRIPQLWRQRNDLVGSYVDAASVVEAEFGLGGIPWTVEAIQDCPTFARLEIQLQALLEDRLRETSELAWVELARQRINGFWSKQNPGIKLRWEIIAKAGEVLLLSDQLEKTLKAHKSGPGGLTEGYSTGDAPWCSLDTTFRHLDRDFHYFDLEKGVHDSLIRLVAAARQRYIQVIDQLTSQFIQAYEAACFEASGITQQVEVFHDFVAPAMQEGPTAYFLVDALRFEMARELQQQYLEDWNTVLTPAIATPPTITEVGMAALMPGAESGLAISSAGAGKLSGVVSDITLRNREERVKYLHSSLSNTLEVIKLDQIAPLKSTKLRKSLSKAELIVVTASDEIDGFWETSPEMARRMQDYVFSQLRRGLRTLFGLGVRRVVITADHGYLAGDKLIPGEAIDPPGGHTADLHRRVWVGKGGANIPNCLRRPLSAFGVGGDFELVTPRGLACFKVPGGSMEYFHGGLSLQELVIPVLVVSPGKEQPSFEQEPAFLWNVQPGSQKITSLFFSVNVEGASTTLFQSPPRVRAEMRVGEQIISLPVSASYGFNDATRDVALEYTAQGSLQLKSNTVMLQITETPQASTVTLYLLDSETGISLITPIEIPIELLF